MSPPNRILERLRPPVPGRCGAGTRPARSSTSPLTPAPLSRAIVTSVGREGTPSPSTAPPDLRSGKQVEGHSDAGSSTEALACFDVSPPLRERAIEESDDVESSMESMATIESAEASSFPRSSVRWTGMAHGEYHDMYLSMSTDLYMLPVAKNEPPKSLHDFRPGSRLVLERLSKTDGIDELNRKVAVEDGIAPGMFGVRVTGELVKKPKAILTRRRSEATVVLLASTKEARDDWMGMLMLRLASFFMIRMEMLAAYSSGPPDLDLLPPEDAALRPILESSQSMPLLTAVQSALSIGSVSSGAIVTAAARHGENAPDAESMRSSLSDPNSSSSAIVANTAAKTSGIGSWVSSLSGALAEVSNASEHVARLFGGVALIGPVFQAVSLMTKVASLMAHQGVFKRDLSDLRDQLLCVARDLSEEMLFILQFGLHSKRFVSSMFSAMETWWGVMTGIERHLLERRVLRQSSVDDFCKGVIDVRRQLDVVRSVACAVEVGHRLQRSGPHEVPAMRIADFRRLSSLRNPREPDNFYPSIDTVPDLPPHIVFEAIPQLEEVQDVVMRDETDASRYPVSTVAIYGSGGMGKTTLCTALANDGVIQDFFSNGVGAGGVYFIDMGQSATAAYVVKSVARCVEHAGCSASASKIDAPGTTLIEAMNIARGVFSGRRVLLIVDNVWQRTGDVTGQDLETIDEWPVVLRRIVSGRGSCFLFSTRTDELIVSARSRIPIGQLGSANEPCAGTAAVTLFDQYLGIGERDPRYSCDARDRILTACCGLPMAIATYGSLVRHRGYNWNEVLDTMSVFDASPRGDETISAVLGQSLMFLDMGREAVAPWLSTEEFDDLRRRYGEHCCTVLYGSLVVLSREAGGAPVHILAGMWGVPLRIAQNIALMFRSYDLARLAPCRWVTNSMMLTLHDLQRSFAEHICKTRSGVFTCGAGEVRDVTPWSFHRCLLDSFCGDVFSSSLRADLGWGDVLGSCSVEVNERHVYVKEQLLRHMEGAMPPGGDGILQECIEVVRGALANPAHIDVSVLEDVKATVDEESALLMRLVASGSVKVDTIVALLQHDQASGSGDVESMLASLGQDRYSAS